MKPGIAYPFAAIHSLGHVGKSRHGSESSIARNAKSRCTMAVAVEWARGATMLRDNFWREAVFSGVAARLRQDRAHDSQSVTVIVIGPILH